MKQADLGLSLTMKRTRKREFLDEMNHVVPWAAFVGLVSPYAPEGKKGRPPFPLEAMLRIHFMHVWTRRGPDAETFPTLAKSTESIQRLEVCTAAKLQPQHFLPG